MTAVRPVGAPVMLPADLSASAVYDRYTRAVGAVFRHHAAVASTLDKLLQARMHALVVRRRLLLGFVVVTLLLVAYLWMGFYLAVRRAVRALDRTSQRMLTGEFPGGVVVESRDELREVVIRSTPWPIGSARSGSAPRTRAPAPVWPRRRWPRPVTSPRPPRGPRPSSWRR